MSGCHSQQRNDDGSIISVQHLKNIFNGVPVHKDVNFQVKRGEVFSIVGPSGCGKTTVLRSILKLITPTSGHIRVLGVDVLKCDLEQTSDLRKRWGMLFQQSALFSSLTLLENVMFPLQEFTNLHPTLIKELAHIKIRQAGLPADAAQRLPSELSGGMKKRGALARAIALDPDIVFLDEPTAGLDPKASEALDDLILHLRDNLGLTVVMVTHDLDSLWNITDRVCFLAEGETVAVLPMDELVEHPNSIIQSYFSGPRGQLRKRR